MRRLTLPASLLLLIPAAYAADPGAGSLLALAQNPRVQKELGLNPDEQAAVGKLTPADSDEKLSGALKAGRMKRLRELSLQARGGAAIATDPRLMNDLKLTEAQRAEIKKLWVNKELDLEMRLKVARFRNDAVREAWILNTRKEHGEAVIEALDEDQKKAFAAMQGKPFDFGDKK